jgi:hypothetical protein
VTNAASAARQPLPPSLTLFLLHLYAVAAFSAWCGGAVIQEIARYGDSFFWGNERLIFVLVCGAVTAWAVFLIRAIHTRSSGAPKHCRIFCWVSVILCALSALPLFLFHSLLGINELRRLLFFPLAGLIFYGCCLYRLITSTTLRRIFTENRSLPSEG